MALIDGRQQQAATRLFSNRAVLKTARFGVLVDADPAWKLGCLFGLAVASYVAPGVLGLGIGATAAGLLAVRYAPSVRHLAVTAGPLALVVTLTAALQQLTGALPLVDSARYALRLAALALLSLALVFTTPLGDLLVGLERLLQPLRAVGVRVRYFTIGVGLAVRLLGAFARTYDDLRRAHRARGLRLRGLVGVRAITLALLLKVERLVDDLALALELRHVNFDDATRVTVRVSRPRATRAVVLGALLLAACMLVL